MSGLDDLINGISGGQGGGRGRLLGGLAGGGGGTNGGLGDILGGLTGSGDGHDGLPGGMGGLLTALLPMVGSLLAGGGLQKIMAGLQANGLAAQAGSWVGTGENEAISGADVRKVVGADEIARIAARLGVSEDEAAAAVAQVLPAVVDSVSPEGHLEPDGELESRFSVLEQLGG
jgi:uncharacterized protein YidB (DUF937 family)